MVMKAIKERYDEAIGNEHLSTRLRDNSVLMQKGLLGFHERVPVFCQYLPMLTKSPASCQGVFG